MSKAILVLLATTVGLGLVSMHLVRELRTQREQTQALQARIDELQRSSQRRPPPPPGLQTSGTPFGVEPAAGGMELRAALRTAPDTAPAAAAAIGMPASTPDELMRRMRDEQERQSKLLQDPEYRDALRTQTRTSLSQMYPDLLQELGLSGDKADQFLDLLAEQQLRTQETLPPQMMWGEQDQPANPAALEEARRKGQEMMRQNESEQADLLGPERFQTWQDYQSTLSTRHEVSGMRSMLAGKGAPIQESQVKPLIKALAQEQQRMMKELSERGQSTGGQNLAFGGTTAVSFDGTVMTMSSYDPTTGIQSDEGQQRQVELLRQQSQRRREAIASILTPQQLRAYDQEQSAQLKLQEANLRLMRAQSQTRTQAQGGSR